MASACAICSTTSIGGDGPLPRKPDPAGLLALMDSAGAGRQATLLVGDSPIDYRTARNAGTRCCLVSFGFGFRGFAHGEPDGIASIAANVGRWRTSSAPLRRVPCRNARHGFLHASKTRRSQCVNGSSYER